MPAPRIKTTFEVVGSVLTIKVSKGRGRELTYKFRNSMPAEKWAEQLLEIVEDIVPNVSGDTRIQHYETFDDYKAADEPQVSEPPGKPPISEEESRRRHEAFIRTFTVNNGKDIQKDDIWGNVDQTPEASPEWLMGAASALPAPAEPVIQGWADGKRLVSPNDTSYMPDVDKRV